MPTFEEELLAKSKKIYAGVHYKSGIDAFDPTFRGKPMQQRLVEEVNKIAETIPGSKVIGKPTGVKSFDSALRKVNGEEKRGDWTLMNDLNRCTLVVLTQNEVQARGRLVRDYFNGRHMRSGLQYDSEKPVTRESNACGYSGYTVFVKSSAGGNPKMGEIQINYPPMMYAKDLGDFRGSMPERVAEMRSRFPEVPGGLGHKMYEVYRDQKLTPIGLAHAAASKLYYDYFRARDWHLGQRALEAVRSLNLPGVVLPLPTRFRGTG
jgi:hypothetical protein